MSLTAAFTVGNNSSVNQSVFVLTDTSTGTDGTVTRIIVTIYDAANNQIPGSPFSFAYTLNAAYNLSVLTQDLAVNIRVDWVNSGGVSQANTSQIFVFTGFLEWYYYGLIQQVSAQNRLLIDTDFFYNFSKLRTLIDSANQSINIGASIFNAEAMILLAQYMANNTNLFF